MPTMKRHWRHALKAVERTARSRPLPAFCPRCKTAIPEVKVGEPKGLVAMVAGPKQPPRPRIFMRACPTCAWFPEEE